MISNTDARRIEIYRCNAELTGPRTAPHDIQATAGTNALRIIPAGMDYWVVQWQSHLMKSPAFWYFATRERAEESFEHFR